MIHKKSRLTLVVALMAVLALFVASCSSDSDGDSSSSDDSSSTPSASGIEGVSGDITGSGASFPDAFYQEAIAGLADIAPDLTVTYNAIGSGSGKEEFGQGLNDFAGSDSLVEEGDGPEEGDYLYIPTTASSVTVAYNLPGVDELDLDADTIAKIFQRDITTWDDPAITELNPDADLPDSEITVARRADGSGTTKNFTKYLEAAAPDTWTLGSDDTVEWPADTQGGQQNTGVAQIVQDTEGAVGYVDLGDATTLELQTAYVENVEGEFVAPSVEGTQAALAGAELADDNTYNPLNGPGEGAYPITAPTYILVHPAYEDAEVGAAVVAFVEWLITDGAADYAEEVGFAPLPDELQQAGLDTLETVQVG